MVPESAPRCWGREGRDRDMCEPVGQWVKPTHEKATDRERNKGRPLRKSGLQLFGFTVPHSGLTLLSSLRSVLHFFPSPASGPFMGKLHPLSYWLMHNSLLLLCLGTFPGTMNLTLKIEATTFSKTLVCYHNTVQHHNPQDLEFNHHCYEN